MKKENQEIRFQRPKKKAPRLTWGLTSTFSTQFLLSQAMSISQSKWPMLQQMLSSFIWLKCLPSRMLVQPVDVTKMLASLTASSTVVTSYPVVRKGEREREREREGERRKWKWRNCSIEYKAWLAPAYGRQEATKTKIDEIATYPLFKIKIIKHVSSDLRKHTHPPSLPLSLTHTHVLPSMAAWRALMGSISATRTRAPKFRRAWQQPLPTSP